MNTYRIVLDMEHGGTTTWEIQDTNEWDAKCQAVEKAEKWELVSGVLSVDKI